MSDIDAVLNEHASRTIADGQKYKWWWNACDVIAEAIASACVHVRDDGCHVLSDDEQAQLTTLAIYMEALGSDNLHKLTVQQEMWLHAESMWLLGQWFTRLWD